EVTSFGLVRSNVTELTSADAARLIDHYVGAATSILRLDATEAAQLRQDLARLAPLAVTRTSDEYASPFATPKRAPTPATRQSMLRRPKKREMTAATSPRLAMKLEVADEPWATGRDERSGRVARRALRIRPIAGRGGRARRNALPAGAAAHGRR